MDTTANNPCVVCGTGMKQPGKLDTDNLTWYFPCPNCGDYIVESGPYITLKDDDHSQRERAILAHEIWKMHKNEKVPKLDKRRFDNIRENCTLPSPAEQADNLILWLGDELMEQGHGKYIELNSYVLRGRIGAQDNQGSYFIIKSVQEKGLLDVEVPRQIGMRTFNSNKYRLSFSGWERYEELKRSTKDSRLAFMAMT